MYKQALIFLFFIFSQTFMMAQAKPKLIYFGDPMCSWCYGFSPEITAAFDSLAHLVDYQLVMGGLRPYNTQTMSDLGDFLKHHWEDVGRRSGQPFNFEILKDTSFVYDTEPACRAVVAMRKLKPELELEFFKKVQSVFYYKNKNTNLTATYSELAGELGLDKKAFAEKFESEEMKALVREDFVFSAEVGVRSFPTLILVQGEHYSLIASGYNKSQYIIERVEKLLKAKAQFSDN